MEGLEHAIGALKRGELVVFPTDTVYGIGLAVRHAPSPQAIYEAKGRSGGKPVAWLVGGASALDAYGLDVPCAARELAARAWPGALTLVVRASDAVPAAFRSQEGTIGLRVPASEAALALVEAAGPIATSSANMSGVAATGRFEEIDPRMLAAAAAAVRGDVLSSGVASTVLDCSSGELRVIREGGVAVP